MATGGDQPSLKRAVVLMTGSSFLVPAAGILTAPILARGLSPDGRGELAAALGPAVLMLAVATIGLPEALTYRLAKAPSESRRAVVAASCVTVALGVLCVGVVWLASPYLSAGDDELATLIVVAAAVTVPALVGNVLRGAAGGLQRWSAVAGERLVLTVMRLVAFTTLFLTGHLTVWSALWVSVLLPLVAALVYLPVLTRTPPEDPTSGASDPQEHAGGPGLRPLLSYGTRIWFGSVAGMLLARLSQLFMVPLSSAYDLGLYTVAITVSDVPIIVSMAVQAALFGVNSRVRDARSTTSASRLTLLIGTAGCLVLGGTLPWWIAPLFGSEFADALVPTWLLLVAALVSVPGLMAASGLAAWGRPGLRSTGMALTLVLNLVTFVLLVPAFGVLGACVSGLVSQLFLTVFTVVWAARVIEVRTTDFWVVRSTDLRQVVAELVTGGRRLRARVRRVG